MNNTRSKTSLFLIEMMLMVLVFALCSAVCVRIFAYSQQLSRDSRNLSNACIVAQSAASCYKVERGDIERTIEAIGGKASGTNRCYYDGDWRHASPDAAVFVLAINESGGVAEIDIRKINADKAIYTLTTKAVYR